MAAQGQAWAQVVTPADVQDPPTLVFPHGICQEREFWDFSPDPVASLVAAGVRLVLPEAPYHGRRRLAGCYGGEPFLARAPLGGLDFCQAAVAEVARLLAWARETTAGPVALGGVSLGAITAQLAASAARHWPEEMRPDALLLLTTSGDMSGMMLEGGLSQALGLPTRLREADWTRETLGPWLSLVEPGDAPGLAPEQVVMVLGEADTITPYGGGLALAERWGVPQANRFISPRGHFTAYFGVAGEPAPLRHFLEVLVGRS